MKFRLVLSACLILGLTSLAHAQTNNDDSVALVIPQKTKVKKAAEFPGGVMGWRKFLERELNRDLPAKKGAPDGKYTAVVGFVVDTSGELTNIKALIDPGFGVGEEAVRVMKESPKWVPATIDGKKVKYSQRQSITFMVAGSNTNPNSPANDPFNRNRSGGGFNRGY